MKHFMRVETRDGLRLPGNLVPTPDHVVIEHEGSGQRYELPITWEKTPTGGVSAVSKFVIPKLAKLGTYSVTFQDLDGHWFGSSSFRVAAFQLPEIGRASCRERVCQYVSISVVAVSLKKKK